MSRLKKINSQWYMWIAYVGSNLKGKCKFWGQFLGCIWSLGVSAFELTVDMFKWLADTLVLSKELLAEPSGNRGRGNLCLDLSCLLIWGCFEAFSQYICNLGFKERRAPSGFSGRFKLLFLQFAVIAECLQLSLRLVTTRYFTKKTCKNKFALLIFPVLPFSIRARVKS